MLINYLISPGSKYQDKPRIAFPRDKAEPTFRTHFPACYLSPDNLYTDYGPHEEAPVLA